MGAIYSITNINSGKRYIGSSKNVRHRFNQHLCKLRKGSHHSPHLQSAWNKYGDAAFSFDILDDHIPDDDLIAKEQYWIERFDAVKNGYNIRLIASSQLGLRHSEETKSAMREKRIGYKHSAETREKISLANIGRKYSDETREKIRAAKIGKCMSEEAKAKMRATHTGKKQSPESCAKKRSANLGRRHGIETIAKIRASHIGMKHSAAAKDKIGAAHRGRKQTKEQIARREASRMKTCEIKRSLGLGYHDKLTPDVIKLLQGIRFM